MLHNYLIVLAPYVSKADLVFNLSDCQDIFSTSAIFHFILLNRFCSDGTVITYNFGITLDMA